MSKAPWRTRIAVLLAVTAGAGCGSATRTVAESPVPRTDRASLSPAALVTADKGIPPYTDADVHFMSGMIPHHAQAVLIAGWAASHGARADVRTLCERIVVAQRDEIATMRRWLRERDETVPDSNATHMTMDMNGMQHEMLMPGMLTPEQLATLDGSRGPAFDELFLTYMIQHHRGALTMVDQLFASPGAANDDTIFKFASDVFADQTTEIDRMEQMLGQ